MSAPGPLCPPVAHPWWWAGDDPAEVERAPTPRVARRGRGVTIRCGPDTTAADVRALDPGAWGGIEVAVLDLGGLSEDAAVVRAVAALRVRLLVRGIAVELRDAPPAVRDAVGGVLDVCYRVVDGPKPGSG